MKRGFELREYNREAWNRQVEKGDRWTLPVGPEVIAAARRGEWSVVLTPNKPVPRAWFGDLDGQDVLGLASAGGQQGPVLAAAGRTCHGVRQLARAARAGPEGGRARGPVPPPRGRRHERPVGLRGRELRSHLPPLLQLLRGRRAARVARGLPGVAARRGAARGLLQSGRLPASIRSWSRRGVMQLKYRMPYSDFDQPHRRGAPPVHRQGRAPVRRALAGGSDRRAARGGVPARGLLRGQTCGGGQAVRVSVRLLRHPGGEAREAVALEDTHPCRA